MTDSTHLTPTHYSAINDEALSKVPRDLRFYPCGVNYPEALTREQTEAYNRDGFVAGIRVFNDTEITGYRIYFDELLNQALSGGKDSYSISTAHMKYGGVYDLLVHPKITAYVADLLGDSVIGWGSHFFCKMPQDPKTVSWHQDASYWPITPSKTATVWLAIDDADVENACMSFIPGTHVHGHLPYRESNASENNVLNQTVDDAVERFGEPVDVELKAGEISLHSDLLLHGSEANRSNRRRCGLTLRYCTADVRAHLGWSGKGVILRGEDPDGHWGNPPRPNFD
ncbi:MAG: phytanoyl-CoA dioxygenase family protein [Candidatus Latescibacterota bacterium]|nr:phytanoyl-CoA dioxygenase family protein [Candidatus Latescibacterota bacterium]